MLNIILRPEKQGDFKIVEELTYKAFLTAEHSAGTEALLVHKLRTDTAFVPELDFVAVVNGEIVGNIIYTKSKVVAENGFETETLTFGPVSVKPELQNQGIGTALIKHTIALACKIGFRAIIIFGHEKYYPRFGFLPCTKYGITTADGQNFDAFMAVPLYDRALDGVMGRFYASPVFENIDSGENELFNAKFI
jgi:predicted N-acetyltransferase YhbS